MQVQATLADPLKFRNAFSDTLLFDLVVYPAV